MIFMNIFSKKLFFVLISFVLFFSFTNSVKAVMTGNCVCSIDGEEETTTVEGRCILELEEQCTESCRSGAEEGAWSVADQSCGTGETMAENCCIPAGEEEIQCVEGEVREGLDCVPAPTATPPGEAPTGTTTRQAPARECSTINQDCMQRFPLERHVFFSNPDCYCCGECGLNDIVNVFINAADYLFGILGALALIFFIYGGVTWLTAGGSAERVDKGRKILIGAVVGIAISLGAWLAISLLQDAIGVKTEFRIDKPSQSEQKK